LSRFTFLLRAIVPVLAVVFVVAYVGDARPAAADAVKEPPVGRSDDQPLPGRWSLADRRASAELSDAQREEIARLQSIGYLSGSIEPPMEQGVTLHDGVACPGLNFYTSGHMTGAVLMDMDGNVLHEWSHDYRETWPDYENVLQDVAEANPEPLDIGNPSFWRRAYLFENGDVLGMCVGLGLVRLDPDSRVVWSYSGGCHHDLEVMEDGTIYVLTREAKILPRVNKRWPILEDSITVLDSSGREIRSLSILEAFEDSRYECYLEAMWPKGDVTHTNTLEVLDGTLASRIPAFRRGNVLVSLLKLDVIAVIDMDLGEVVWAMSGMWHKQHQPTVVGGDRILIFDNEGRTLGGGPLASRVLEFDPATQEIVWSYEAGAEFYSKRCGTAERLPNGNTLITESDAGRAFEVTPEGRIVWEFLNPARAGANLEYIATLLEVVRVPPEFPTDWLRRE